MANTSHHKNVTHWDSPIYCSNASHYVNSCHQYIASNILTKCASSFSEYFESLLSSETAGKIPDDCTDKGPLDYTIEYDKLKDASSILKPGKSHGIDIICNEMIKILLECYPDVLLKLFNSILSTGKIVQQWVIGMIVPIYKKGSKSEPSNYRGVTLMSCLGKLFLSILNARLLKYAIDNKILSKKQLGFLAGNRTSDAHIIIHNMIRKY